MSKGIENLIVIASNLHEMSQHNRQIVFGMLNELLIRDNKKVLVRDSFGEAYNRQGGTSNLDEEKHDSVNLLA